MRPISKKILALVLSVMMVISLFPAVAFAETASMREGRMSETLTGGYIPMEYHGGRTLTDAYLRGEGESTNASNPVRATLPSSYDSRDYGYITAVKNQNPYGTCWTFGTMAPIEAYMIKHGIINKDTGAAATSSMDLSELHLAWFNYTSAYDKLGMLTGDSSKPLSDTFLDQGGNGAMATFTVMRWAGPASENTSALKYSAASTSGLDSKYAYDYNVAHVTDVTWIPTSNKDAVKQAIMEYGAATISYYHADTYLNSSTSAYCFKQTASYGSSNYQYGNHAVTVVGWDDNYSKSNFKSSYGPSSNGAWIIKNSWGTSWGKSGYFYLSYEDTASLNDTCYFYKVSDVDNYNNCYQYDGTCNVANYQAMGNNCQIANIFTANGSEQLKAVAIAPWDEATTYTLQVYKNPSSATNPTSGTLMCTQNGYFEYSGYYTVPLNTPVSLASGDKFAVVFTLSTPTADSDDGKYVHIPYDASAKISWCQWTHANHGNTSFYKEANGSWTDVPDNGDFRIKAYTDDASFTVTAVSNNTAYGTVSVNGTKITATPANGYYVSDAKVTSGTATYTITGNVITVNPSTDCTVQVIFAKKPVLTVNLVACGASVGSQTAYIQDSITLPTTATAVDGYSFVGWAESTVAETTVKPACYAPGAEYVVNANATLYALYARTEGSNEIIYEIVADPITDWTGKYIITSGKDSGMLILKGISGNTSYESSSAGGSATLSASGMTLDGTVLKNASDAYVFEIASTGSAYTIKNLSTGTYLGSYNNYLYSRSSYSSSYCNWAMEYDTYSICMKVSNSASSSYPYLVKGSNSYFVINSGYTTNKTQFWKQTTASTTYYNTDPVVATHTHSLSYTAAVAATCGAEGHSAYYYCAGCGKYFSDAAANNEITLASTVIPATGSHSYGAYSSNNNGTHKHVCTVCGHTETANCSYRDVVTAPTATEQGYTTHTCTVCGYSYKDSYTPALGNDYVITFSVPEGVAAVAPMSCNSNSSVTLPTAAVPEGYTFLGWVTGDYDNVSAKPTAILTGSYTATGNITLKALYAYTEGNGGETVYELLTAAPSNWSGNYVITNGSATTMYVLKGVTPGSNGAQIESSANTSAYTASGMSLSDNTLSNVAGDYVFTLAATGSYYTLQSKATGAYVGMTSSSYLAAYTTYSSSYCRWTPALNTSGAVSLKNVASGSYPYLSFSSSYKYFWSGSSSNAYVLRLWKETAGSGTTYYTTVIGTAEHTHTAAAAVKENVVAATCTAAGSYDEVVYCAVCGEELSRTAKTVAALGHNPGTAVKENEVAATATTEGGYDMVVYCTRCGAELSREHTTVPATGVTTYTVSFSVPSGVSAVAAMTAEAGSSITLPTAGAPSGYTFLGWVTSAVNNATEMPDVLTGSYQVNGNVTLRALYSYTSTTEGGETAYQLLDSAPSSWAGNYIITYGTNTSSLYVLKGLSGNTKYESSSAGGATLYSNTGMTYADGYMTGVTNAYVFTVAATGSYYTIRNASTGTYLGSYNSYLYSRSSYSSSYCRWTLSMSSGNVTAKNTYSSRYPYLSFSSSGYFMINSSAPTGLYFWKETTTGGSTVTYYTTG